MKALISALVFIVLAGCNALGPAGSSSDFVNDGYAPVVPAIQSTHGGWTTIKAVGAKVPVSQATDLIALATGASVTLAWNNATAASGTIASYSLYRSSTSGGARTLIASGITTAARTYTDSTVTSNQTYYYKAVPVLSSGEITSLTGADAEIKIMVPPDNMVLLHRWAANMDMCNEMGKTPIRSENYRCVVATGGTAPPGTGGSGYMDFGGSIFIDMFEQGCNYTYSSSGNKCGSANGCIGVFSNPHTNVAGNAGDVYYSRRVGSCYINTSAGSGGTWTALSATSTANRRIMTSNAPGLAPVAWVSQDQAQEICTGQTVPGIAGTKRLLRRKEMVAVAAWDPSLSDATIDTIENGVNLDTTGHCNSNFGSPQGTGGTAITGDMAYSNAAYPAALDTLPSCLNDVCSGTASSVFRGVRTGSIVTRNCVSKYGAQDLVGNVWEFHSDQINCTGAACTGVAAASNTVDSTNDDFSGVAFDNTQAPTSVNDFSNWGRIQFPLGIPIASGGFTGDGVVTRTSARLHDDLYRVNPASAVRTGRSGGSWFDSADAGRFELNFNYSTASSSGQDIGFRCAISAD